MTGLVLKDIRKSYGAVDVIHGIDPPVARTRPYPGSHHVHST